MSEHTPRAAFRPRQPGDKRPWLLTCDEPVSYWEAPLNCYCRRFRNEAQAKSWIARRLPRSA